MEENTLLDTLKKRYSIAKDFTKKKYINQAKRAMEDYDVVDEAVDDLSILTNRHRFDDPNERYNMRIPLIFTNTEAMKASLFERLPDLIFKGRGQDDDQRGKIVNGAYEYLKDKLNLFDIADQSAHWFILTGFCSAQANFESRGEEEEMEMEDGQTVPQINYHYNDPKVEVMDPEKTFFGVDSVFDYKADKISYYCWYKLMDPLEIKNVYEVEVEADTSIVSKSDDLGEEKEEGLDDEKAKTMTKVMFYCGELPYQDIEEFTEFGVEYDADKEYFFIFTNEKILYIGEKYDKYLRIAKWYGHPTDFFGFGMGKIGRQFQIEKSIRRGQQIRYADIAAYPKYTVDDMSNISEKDILDPRAGLLLKYSTKGGGKEPGILQPGSMGDIVSQNSQEADSDAQKAFGILDLNTGSQSSTVDTATGQTIFAQAASRRIEFAKKKFMAFYRELVILLLKLCQEHWDEDKIVKIMGEDGKEEELVLNKESLKDINFDTDIDIDMESLSVNKDVVRQQFIALYDKTKDDPLIERKEVIREMLNQGFEIKNTDRFIKDVEIVPGTILINPQTQEQYQVGESGELISAAQQRSLAPTSGSSPTSNPGSMQDVLNTMPSTPIPGGQGQSQI